MKAKLIPVSKGLVIEFLNFALEVRGITPLEFSADAKGDPFVPDRQSWNKEKDRRRYIRNGPPLFETVVKEHARWRSEGGRFRIDLHGAYCLDARCYFIEWIRSSDLLDFERSIPDGPVPPASVKWVAQIAKSRLG